MPNVDWSEIQERLKNSVVQIICDSAKHHLLRPFQGMIDQRSAGSGFIVDIKRGLILTNAHVMANTISAGMLSPKTGERLHKLELVSICKEKDLALVRIDTESIAALTKGMKHPENLNVEFADHLALREADSVLALGYPLGQKGLKSSEGVVSGSYANNDDTVDETMISSADDQTSFIQITANLNPGSSGGLLVNTEGKAVGVNAAGILFANGIGFAIGSRVVMSAYWEMARPLTEKIPIPYVVNTPRTGFGFSRTNKALLDVYAPDNSDGGIYITEVYPNSCFDVLSEGDVILNVQYEDIYHDNPAAFNVVKRYEGPGKKVTGVLDEYGQISFDIPCGTKGSGLPACHDLSLKEFFDMVPMNAEVTMQLSRQGKLFEAQSRFVHVPSTMRQFVYPRFQPLKYAIVAGMCLMEMTMNHAPLFVQYAFGKQRFRQMVFISQIFPDSEANRTRSLAIGDIVTHINDTKIKTIEDVTAAIKEADDYLIFKNKMKAKFVISKAQAKAEDKAAAKMFEIHNFKSLI